MPVPPSAKAAGLDVTMTVPDNAGPRTPGKVTVTNNTQRTVKITTSIGGDMTAMAVADGHQISTGAIDGSLGVATVKPQSSVILTASLFGYQCDQSGESGGAGAMPMLPAGDYTFVPTILITPEGKLAGEPTNVHWTG